ncbi:MAG: Ig-like domain-containing protein [Myxococcaceae bacterium]|nr:Ig-like domain-containing protein [Myxococcaceae bacterium]
MRRLSAVLLFSLCGACINIDTGDDGGGFITAGPNGGIFVRQGAVIDIPKNALATESQISVTVIDTGVPEVPGRKRISFGYRFAPAGLKFSSPSKITLPYLEDRVPAGVDPGTFDSRRQTGSDPYLALAGTKTLTEFKAVEAQTDGLGLFWLTSPAEPNIAVLELTPDEKFMRVGETQKFDAAVKSPTGDTVDVPLTWAVAPPRVGTITPQGDFTANAPGWATITVRAASQSKTATVRVQGSAVGPVSFVHENPFPTGNDLYGGAVVPGVGALFVGANSTVLSRDALGNWSRLFSNPGITLRAIGGSSPTNAAAVGTAGNTGVLVELKAASAAPVVTPFTTLEPRAMWFDGTHGMAVGYGNDVLLRDAASGTWKKEYSPSIETLLSVVGDGTGVFVTVGSRGSLYRWDPAKKVWDSLYQTQLSVLLTAAQLVNPTGTEAWAVGGNKLWHFSGGAWASINIPSQYAYSEATSLGTVDGRVVVGVRTNKTGALLVYSPTVVSSSDGGMATAQWVWVPWRDRQIPRGFFGDGTQGYAVGDFGAVWSYGQGTFTELSRGFYGDVAGIALSGADVFAAVNECADMACTLRAGEVMKRTGPGTWEAVGTSAGGGAEITGIIAGASNDLTVTTVVGARHWDGFGWTMVNTGGATRLNAIRQCGVTTTAVGPGAVYARGNPSQLVSGNISGAGNLYALYCKDDSQSWAAGDGSLFMRSSAGAWSARNSMTLRHADYRAVWSPAAGEAFAFGVARYGVYWNTVDLMLMDTPGGISPDQVNALWGSSIDNLYAAGFYTVPAESGFVVRFDGAQWQLVDSGSQHTVKAINGSSNTDVWIGTEAGGLLKGVAPP